MTKRKAFTIKEKLELVDRIRNGETQSKVVKDTGVNESTLRGWLRSEAKLRSFAETVEKDGLSRKKARLAADPQLDSQVLNFFVDQRDKGLTIDGPLILAQAKKINLRLHGEEGSSTDDFTVSRGWLDRWKKRHGVCQFKANGESKSADHQAAEDFIPEFQQFVQEEDLCPEQIYNTDETGLCHKIMPDRTLAFHDDKTAKEGFKKIKDRITILLACNWEGTHKLKPMAIGRFKNPRCFHHVNKDNLSVIYRHSKNAWMTRDIFSDWFHNDFVPNVRKHLRSKNLEEKAVLLLDNCPAHPPASELVSKNGKIHVYYLPKNTTSKIQPCDQGIIANYKRHYRHASITGAVEAAVDVPVFFKSRAGVQEGVPQQFWSLYQLCGGQRFGPDGQGARPAEAGAAPFEVLQGPSGILPQLGKPQLVYSAPLVPLCRGSSWCPVDVLIVIVVIVVAAGQQGRRTSRGGTSPQKE